MSRIAVGVDIGGSHVTSQLYEIEHHQLVEGTRSRLPIDCHGEAGEVLDGWCRAIRGSTGGHSLVAMAGIGFAMPGPFDYPSGVARFRGVEKFDALYGVDVRREVMERLDLSKGYPVVFQNDATCFAIGVSYESEVKKHARFLAITLGTGFGSTFIHNHQPVAGQDGVPQSGFLYDEPFNGSNADNHFSTRWFTKRYQNLTGKKVSGVKELADMASDDQVVATLFRDFGDNLGFFLAPYLKSFNAACLVMGGNIALAYPLFRDRLHQKLHAAGIHPEVLVSSLGEEAALSGAAALCSATGGRVG